MHLNSNAAFGGCWFNTDRGAFLLWHRPRSWPSQPRVLLPPQRSRPSAFASLAVSLPTTQIQRHLAAGYSRLSELKPELPGYVVESRGIAAQGCQSRGRFWLIQVVCLVQGGQGGCRASSAARLVAAGRLFPVQLRNATKKRSAA
jgi:hypothetical protein